MSVSPPPTVGSFPSLAREQVSWRTVAPGRVEIAVELSNDGLEPTEPGDLVIEAAAFGAFVPSRPVARIALGSLEPGERRRVATTVPRRVLQAAAGRPFGAAMTELLRQISGVDARIIDDLAHAEWIGNLNVYFDRRPDRAVERHCAFGLRIQAGRPVAAMLILPGPDGFEVDVACSDPAWSGEVLRPMPGLDCLLVRPPAAAGERGEVTVRVTRVRDGRVVPVEFAFETVAGTGEKLGCIEV